MTTWRLQDLPPKWAHFCLGIERFVTKELNVRLQDTTLVIAYSTGVDSTALLYIFHMLAPRLHLRLVGANLDHGLRPEAAREQQIARQTCSQLGIPLECARRDIASLARQQSLGLEETGRLERYRFLEAVRAKHNADFILTAHQADDLAEDVLMRLIRGVGWPGLAGMAGVDQDRHLVRPLLQTPKQVLEQFLTHLGITWEKDASNADPSFLRNRVRSTILPLFLQENPGFLKTVYQLWQCGQADRSFWDQRLAQHLQGRKQYIPSSLAGLDKAERCRLIKHVLESMGPGQPLAESISRLDALWQNRATGKTVQFPGDKTATITRDGIEFSWKP
ncbi:tRNA lysidine(34) synthetase TilS [Desulfoplanes formicivorans]|uniref:tRNA(Ile)-lysidine synthase n=1 Tax=Desulfoplanes formicivorans TaxID=1592317 RepID=A0A194AI30_9BACT|nr:tRNA lysidine(34) synthetase TilS [Desulfoplanes formicivorans]GAU08983.1 tRNA(Ile)-lysidine synthetase [Desulfoplanes formicivorans]